MLDPGKFRYEFSAFCDLRNNSIMITGGVETIHGEITN